MSVDVARSSSAASRLLLSKVGVGAKVSVFWPDEDRSRSGKVTERHPDQGHHVYTLCCDSGDTKTIDLVTQTCCIFGDMHADFFDAQDVDGSRAPLTFPKTAQGRELVPALHAAFLVSDNDAEIYWPNVGHVTKEQCGWRLFRPDKEKIRCYYRLFETNRCEVEWNQEGLIYDTFFRMATHERRKKKNSKDKAPASSKKQGKATATDMTPAKKMSAAFCEQKSKKLKPNTDKRLTGSRRKPSNDSGGDSLCSAAHCIVAGVGVDPDKPHYITDKLSMTYKLNTTRLQVILTFPEEMRNSFNACCWVSWKVSCVGVHFASQLACSDHCTFLPPCVNQLKEVVQACFDHFTF